MLSARPLHLISAAGAALALTVLLALLGDALTRAAVARQGLAAWTDWHDGVSPWRWALRQPRDVIAGRAFGRGRLAAGADALALEGWGPVQVGLRLTHPAPLAQAPVLQLDLRRSRPWPLTLIVRPALAAPQCTAAAGMLPRRPGTMRVDLATLRWRCNGHPAPMPAQAAMLRLAFAPPQRATIALDWVRLRPPVSPRLEGPIPLARLRAAPRAPGTVPVVWLPAWFSSRLLAQRDALWRQHPAAVALPAGVVPHAVPQRRHAGLRADAAIGACALLMALGILPSLRRRVPRMTDALQPLLAMAPVLLIAFGVGDSQAPDLRSGMLILLALGYALLLARLEPANLRPWRLCGPASGASLPLLPLLPAAVLWLLQGRHAPQAIELARYLPWAALQQFLVLAVVARRLDAALGRRAAAVLAAAALFALGHAPNTALMLLAFAAELYWAWCFLRGGALLPVVLAHALCGTLLQAIASDGGWLRSLAIGARYLGGTG